MPFWSKTRAVQQHQAKKANPCSETVCLAILLLLADLKCHKQAKYPIMKAQRLLKMLIDLQDLFQYSPKDFLIRCKTLKMIKPRIPRILSLRRSVKASLIFHRLKTPFSLLAFLDSVRNLVQKILLMIRRTLSN